MTRHLDSWRMIRDRPEPMARSTGMLLAKSFQVIYDLPCTAIASIDIQRDEIHGDVPITMNRLTRL